MMKNFGYTLAQGALLIYAAASGTETTKAVGYSFLVLRLASHSAPLP